MAHTPETTQITNTETILGIAPEVLGSTQNFEECRRTLNNWLTVKRTESLLLDLHDEDDLTLTLAMETAEAFGIMAGSLIRGYGAEEASPAIARAWLIDDNERAQLLNNLSGYDEIIVYKREDFDEVVFYSIADDIDTDRAATKLATEFASLLHNNIAEYACLLEDEESPDEAFEEGYMDISVEDLEAYRDVLAMKSLRAVLRLEK